MSCTEETPPDAMTGSVVTPNTSASPVEVGPREHPVALDGGEHHRGESGVGELGEHLDDRSTAGLLPAADARARVVRSLRGGSRARWRLVRGMTSRPRERVRPTRWRRSRAPPAPPRRRATHSASSRLRTPPPDWTGTDTARAMAITRSRLTGRPERAASRSTTCSQGAPAATKASASSSGSP